jgi:hypothetical protein
MYSIHTDTNSRYMVKFHSMLALLELVFFVRSKEVDCVFDELTHAYIHARLVPNSLTYNAWLLVFLTASIS